MYLTIISYYTVYIDLGSTEAGLLSMNKIFNKEKKNSSKKTKIPPMKNCHFLKKKCTQNFSFYKWLILICANIIISHIFGKLQLSGVCQHCKINNYLPNN